MAHCGGFAPAALLFGSPDHPDARSGKKRDTESSGSKVDRTGSCHDDTPNLITAVTTTPATRSDWSALPTSQNQLDPRQVRVGEPIGDCGSVPAEQLLTSQSEQGIDVIGPAADDQSWQGQAGNGFAAAQVVSDWDARPATCPQGQRSEVWMERTDRHGPATSPITFSKGDLGGMPAACRRHPIGKGSARSVGAGAGAVCSAPGGR